jgi:hypothetical protein
MGEESILLDSAEQANHAIPSVKVAPTVRTSP